MHWDHEPGAERKVRAPEMVVAAAGLRTQPRSEFTESANLEWDSIGTINLPSFSLSFTGGEGWGEESVALSWAARSWAHSLKVS